MKHIKLLLIINLVFFINSCKNEKKEIKEENIKVETIKTDTIANRKNKDTITTFLEVEDTIKIKQGKSQQDSINKENLTEVNTLEVIIDGKVFHKIDKNDVVVKGNKFHYYNAETDYYYDIITRKTVYDYGKHGISTPEK